MSINYLQDCKQTIKNKQWIISLGEGVKVVGPDDVVEMMKEEIKRLTRQYVQGGMWEGDIATPLKQIKDLLELLFIVPGKVS